MKQWITEDQFNELTDTQKEAWNQWCRDHHYTMKEVYVFDYYKDKPEMILNFPSIGEMIEFIADKGLVWTHEVKEPYAADTLCDQLWESTKEVLNSNTKDVL